MCDIWKANKHGAELGVDDLRPHLQALEQLNVQLVVLSGGEALMHSNLWLLCRELKKRDIKITLLSTGLLLEKNAAAVVRWADEVILSLDGSSEVHSRIRNIPRAFEKLSEGVKAVKTANPDFRITARCVVQKMNFRDLPNIIDSAKQLGLDQLSFLPADTFSTAFNRKIPWDDEKIAEVVPDKGEVCEMEDIVENLISVYKDEFDGRFIAESPRKMRHIVQYYRAVNGLDDYPPVHCNAPWVSAVWETNGEIKPCFFHKSYGSLNGNNLDELLNSNNAVKFRKHLNTSKNPICSKCVCSLNLPLPANVKE